MSLLKKKMPEDNISRREFLKLTAAAALSIPLSKLDSYINLPPDLHQDKVFSAESLKSRTITAHQAASYAQNHFENKPYKFGERDCAMFAAQFASYHGIPLEKDNSTLKEYNPEVPKNKLPDATTVKQVKWFEKANSYLKSDLIIYPKNSEIADEKFWLNINPGSLIYLRTAGESQHGYNQYSHVASFIGTNENQEPTFAEYAPGMENGPQSNRSLKQLLSMYHGNIPNDLSVCIVNVPELSVKLWKDRNEKVVPNCKILLKDQNYQQFLTVNINSGIATYWEKRDENIFQRPFANGNMELYSVTGRALLPRTTLTEKYNQYVIKYKNVNQNLDFTSYGLPAEKTACFYGTPLCVPRFYLTPPLIFELQQFSWVSNFGNLGGATDIALMHTLFLNQAGTISKVETQSDYTIHATPQRTRSQQDLLLRDQILNLANTKKTPPPISSVHLTSGCVNFTPETFEIVKNTLKEKAIVIFSYPDFPQDIQLRNNGFSLAKDPLGGLSHLWGYTEL